MLPSVIIQTNTMTKCIGRNFIKSTVSPRTTYIGLVLCIVMIVFVPRTYSKPVCRGPLCRSRTPTPAPSTLITSPKDMRHYLKKYGWLVCPETVPNKRAATDPIDDSETEANCTFTDNEVRNRLKSLQKHFNLPQTGELDEQTKMFMSKGRCGNSDMTMVDEKTGKDKGSKGGGIGLTPFGRKKRDTDTEFIETKVTPTKYRHLDQLPSRRRRRELQIMFGPGTPNQMHMLLMKNVIEFEETVDPITKEHPDRRRLRKQGERIYQDIVNRKKRSIPITDNETESGRQKRQSEFTEQPIEIYGNEITPSKFKKTHVSWRVNQNGRLPKDKLIQTTAQAFMMWASVTNMQFSCSEAREVDVQIDVVTGLHGSCPRQFDGRGGEIAHSGAQSDVHIDNADDFKDPKNYDADGYNLLQVCVHEIGHVLGLPHSDDTYSLMHPVANSNHSNMLPPSEGGGGVPEIDKQAIKQLYGNCTGNFDTVFDWLRADVICADCNPPQVKYIFNTYFFRNSSYWLYSNKEFRTPVGYPELIQSSWGSLPSHQESVTNIIQYRNGMYEVETVFFKGTKTFTVGEMKVNDTYSSAVVQKEEDLKYRFPMAPTTIDAAYYEFYSSQMFFFVDKKIVITGPRKDSKARQEVLFTDVFKQYEQWCNRGSYDATKCLDGNIESVYWSYSHNRLFLFRKGSEDVWKTKLAPSTCPYPPNGCVRQFEIEYVGHWNNVWNDICDVDLESHLCA